MNRFRTYFPEDYKRLYPNATSTRERTTPQSGLAARQAAPAFNKAKRKDRIAFTKAEDENLLIGFGRHRGKWSLIQKDDSLGLKHRRSTDLRDRFRNAFPEQYIRAGFKSPPVKQRHLAQKKKKSPSNDSGTNVQTFEFHTSVGPSPLPAPPIAEPASIPPSIGTESQSTTAIITSQSTGGDFESPRLAWPNHNAAAQKEMEMAMKIRRALDISSASEMMGDTDIPLDPGLSDVAYQPHTQDHDPEGLTELLGTPAVQHGTWKRD
jgi:Myb-like DNA-binding domain